MIKYILLDLILSCLISIYINRDNLLYVIKQIIKNNKIKLINKVNYENRILYYFKLPYDLSYKNFINVIDELEFIYDTKFEYFLEDGLFVIVKTINKIDTFYEFEYVKNNVVLGKSIDGYEYFTFDNADKWSILIAGISGSGKSMIMKSLILQLYLLKKKIVAIDLKGGIEFDIFNNFIYKCINNIGEAEEFFISLKDEIYKRYERIKSGEILEDEYVFCDEFTNVIENKKVKKVIEEIIRIARASGIHFVFATQRPDYLSIPVIVRSNIPVTLAFRTKDVKNSMLIIGDNRLVNLNTGRFINTYNNKEIQGFYIDEKIIKKYLHI